MKFDRSLQADPGVEVRLSPLVSRLLAPNPGPFTFKGTGVYILGAGAQVAVIDPGPDMMQHVEALKGALGPRRISHILVTHTHRDHSPAAAAMKAWSGAKTYGLPLRPLPARAGTGTSPTDRFAGGGGGPVLDIKEGTVDEAHDHDFVPDVMVHDGMRIAGDGFELECIATPGHTANHICYALKEERALFSGDHVMGWSTSVIAPPDGDMGDYLASLERLQARKDAILYPTHGSPISNPDDWIGALIGHRHLREQQIRAALARGDQSVAELVEQLYPQIEPGLRAAAAQQILAHLHHMQSRSEVMPQEGRWKL
jgi:glyoxylase-like metal-dependent hydrolase (beta-lactamase superfamily II)